MSSLMTAMFWSGLVMALPPVVLAIALAIYVYRRNRSGRAAPLGRSGRESR